MATKPLKKMSLGYMGLKGNIAVKEGKQVFMARVTGVIQDVKHKERKDGTVQSYFVGEFLGITSNDEFEAEILYLPGFMHEKLEGVFKAGNEAPVQFGYDIFSAPNEKSSSGFGYVAQNIIKTEASDVMRQLREELSKIPLPGTETEEKPKKKSA